MSLPLTVENVIQAYSLGIFPMADERGAISWYSPEQRCVIELEDFRIPSRLLRTMKKFQLRINSSWNEVIAQCANRESTWISRDIVDVYTKLHKLGMAHSVEAYCDGALVGGLYGVALGGAFMGESMFHKQRDASKACLVFLVEVLRQKGYSLLDCQYPTEHLISLGAHLVSKSEYLARLQLALKLPCRFVI